MDNAQAGLYRVDRENNELTHTLGNPEHTGQTPGKGVSVTWKEGFSQHEDPYGYKSRKRKKNQEADRIRNVERELAGMKKMMEELRQGSSLIHLKRIYKFLCSMLVYAPFALCFVTLRGIFMHFPELTY
jgi:hypothetical protein